MSPIKLDDSLIYAHRIVVVYLVNEITREQFAEVAFQGKDVNIFGESLVAFCPSPSHFHTWLDNCVKIKKTTFDEISKNSSVEMHLFSPKIYNGLNLFIPWELFTKGLVLRAVFFKGIVCGYLKC